MSTTGWIVLGAIVVAIALWAIMIYNGLVAMRQRGPVVRDIDVQLRQRTTSFPTWSRP